MSDHHILLTIDVEDWFQVENLRAWNPPEAWPERELRVETSTLRVLDLLDALSHQQQIPKGLEMAPDRECQGPSARGKEVTRTSNELLKIQATFFVLGWVARRCPDLIREIRHRGHEVASHGVSHRLCADMSCQELERDLRESKQLLEDITNLEVLGYRAPSFSISESVLKRIQQAGYRYDSSYNSFALHHRYGKVDFQNPDSCSGVAIQAGDSLFEIPISNLILGGKVVPWGGGGYFRLLPFPLFRWGVDKILRSDGCYVFYLHPWEFDPEQPRVQDISWPLGFRHYVNLDKTETKLKKLIASFGRCRFASCREYLRDLGLLGKTEE